jgi:hypothetical protein
MQGMVSNQNAGALSADTVGAAITVTRYKWRIENSVS